MLRKTDHFILWGLLTPLLAYTGWTKWAVVHTHTPLADWALLDFVRLHAGYYGLILLWCAYLLQDTGKKAAWRLAVLLLTGYFVAADFAYSLTIFYTGALAPFDVAYYMGKAIDRLFLSIPTAEWLTLALMPAAFIALAAVKWQRRQRSPKTHKGRTGLVLTTLLLVCMLVPPLSTHLELNTARPSYAYQFVEFLKQRTLMAQAIAEEAKPAAALSINSTPRTPHNLVIISLESVGALATSLYNPALPDVTPFLNELAQTSWVAQQAYTPHIESAGGNQLRTAALSASSDF